MISRKSALILVLLISIAIRISIFYPKFFPTADAPEFATFVHEIALNRGLVPNTNSLYFPGSNYIYPPLLFLVTYYFDLPFMLLSGGNQLVPLYTLFFFAVISGAVTNFVIYRNTARDDVPYSRVLSFIVPVFFGVDIYALTWGGYPYIVDTMLLVFLLFLLDKQEWKKSDYIYVSIISVCIPLTHDLTGFVATGSMVLFLLFNVLKRRRNMIMRSVLVLGLLAISLASWWIPRISFVLGALSLNQSMGSGVFSPVGSGTLAVYLAVPFAIPILVLAVLELAGSVKAGKFEKVDSFSIVLIATAAGLIFILKDPAVGARIILYSYTMLMIVVLKNVHTILPLGKGRINGKKFTKAVRVTVLVFVVAGIPSQALIGAYSSNYYSSGDFAYDQQLVSWAETHLQNGTVAAPSIGNYLSAVSGVSVILYSGFLVGTNQITERNAVIDLMFNPHSNATAYNVTLYNIKYLVIQNKYIGSTVDGHLINLQQSPFKLMQKFQYYSVYSVSY